MRVRVQETLIPQEFDRDAEELDPYEAEFVAFGGDALLLRRDDGRLIVQWVGDDISSSVVITEVKS